MSAPSQSNSNTAQTKESVSPLPPLPSSQTKSSPLPPPPSSSSSLSSKPPLKSYQFAPSSIEGWNDCPIVPSTTKPQTRRKRSHHIPHIQSLQPLTDK